MNIQNQANQVIEKIELSSHAKILGHYYKELIANGIPPKLASKLVMEHQILINNFQVIKWQTSTEYPPDLDHQHE